MLEESNHHAQVLGLVLAPGGCGLGIIPGKGFGISPCCMAHTAPPPRAAVVATRASAPVEEPLSVLEEVDDREEESVSSTV